MSEMSQLMFIFVWLYTSNFMFVYIAPKLRLWLSSTILLPISIKIHHVSYSYLWKQEAQLPQR